MFTHLLTESGFGASFELGGTPKPAGPPSQGSPLCNSTSESSRQRPSPVPSLSPPPQEDGCEGDRGVLAQGRPEWLVRNGAGGQGKERRARVLTSEHPPSAFATWERPLWPCQKEARDQTEEKGETGSFLRIEHNHFRHSIFFFHFDVCIISISPPFPPILPFSPHSPCFGDAASCPVSYAEVPQRPSSAQPIAPASSTPPGMLSWY